MTILGVDPGSVITGYGALTYCGGRARLLACGFIKPPAKLAFPDRLLLMHGDLCRVIAETRPTEVALEATFYGANVQTLMKMCHARGAILLALAGAGLPVFEYSPREVKKAVVGNGNASKQQVAFMVRTLFGAAAQSSEYDASDALAVAMCHANRRPSPGLPNAAARFEEKLATATEGPGPADALERKLALLGVSGVRLRKRAPRRSGRR